MKKESNYEIENLEDEEELIDADYDDSELGLDSIGLYLTSLPKDLLTEEEEKELGYRILDGDKAAIDEMVKRNLKLVVSIAKRYRGRGLDFEDVIQNGNMGLIVAAERFDVRKGFRFSTYATHWILQAIKRELDNTSRTIRIPAYFCEYIKKYSVLKDKLTRQYGKIPTNEEMARKLNVSVKVIEKCEVLMNESLSINVLVGEDKATELEAFIPSEVKTPEEEMLDTDLKERVTEILNSGVLDSRELEIIKLRFGFLGKPLKLEEIGQQMGLTRERIRQLESRALKKLKNSKANILIKSYSIKAEDKGTKDITGDSSCNVNYGKRLKKGR